MIGNLPKRSFKGISKRQKKKKKINGVATSGGPDFEFFPSNLLSTKKNEWCTSGFPGLLPSLSNFEFFDTLFLKPRRSKVVKKMIVVRKNND